MAENTQPNDQSTSEEDGKNTDGKGAGADTETAKPQDAPKFTQDDLNALATKVRREEKDKYERKETEAKLEAEKLKAKEQGEHKELAERYEAELKELKPQLEIANAEVEKYKVAIAEVAKAELKALPESVREVAPAQYDDEKALTNPLEVLAWLPKGKKLAEQINGRARPGAGEDPKPKSSKGDPKLDEAARASQAGAFRSTF